MKQIIYYCDRCKQKIDHLPYKLIVDCETEGGFSAELDDYTEQRAAEIESIDFCPKCLHQALELIDPVKTEEEPEAEPEPEQPKRRKLDMGKIKALHNNGWPPKEIAADMGVDPNSIHQALYRLRKAGEIA